MSKLGKTLYRVLVVGALILLTGCGGKGVNQSIEGVDGPNVNVAGGHVTLSMVFQNISIDGGATIPIPKYPNSSLQVGPDFQSDGTILSLSISVADFLSNKGTGLDPQTLPGGRPLPGVAAGALPAIALTIPQLSNSVLYLGPTVIGFFVPFKELDLAGSILTYRFYNSSDAAVGNLSLVGSDRSGKNAGILMLLDADLLGINGKASRKRALNKYMKMGY